MLVSSYLDNLGSPAVVTDESGNVIKEYRYYAFGELRSQSGVFSTDYSFTGYLKEETGNHYAKMRYYEGGIGRFLRVDPLGALNPYVYCGNDPLNFVDPEGMFAEMAGPTDIGERLEGEGSGLFGSFGDWCSGGGPEQEDLFNEFMDELQDLQERVDNYLREKFGDNYQEVIGNNIEKFIEAINYIDVNGTFGNWVGGTGGLIFTKDGIHPYVGFGLVGTPMKVSFSLTFSSDPVSLGWNAAIQGTRGISAQMGIHCYSMTGWTELGGGWPQGVSLTAIYVFKPFKPIWWKHLQ